jgi:ATP-dependent helicase/nuclease subunit A
MNFTHNQQIAVTHTGNLAVTAGAGSGKTHVLVERYLRLLTEGVQHAISTETVEPASSDILAITFTDKAAREMRERVRDTIEKRARAADTDHERAAWEEYRAQIEAARIGTIHAFCAALLRAQPVESGLDPQVAVLDEVEQGLLLAESIDATLRHTAQQASVAASQDSAFALLHKHFSLDELRTVLTEMVRGGGEVRAVVQELPDTPDALLAFWREQWAAAQAAALHELLHAPSWRSACDILQRLAPTAPAADNIGKQVCEIAESLAQIGADKTAASMPDFSPVSKINLRGGSKKGWQAPDDKDDAKNALRTLREVYQTQAELLERVPDDDLEHSAAQVTLALCSLYRHALAEYTQRKERQNALDFDDLEWRTCTLLESHAGVRARWQAEFQAILVDEFQDTNHVQRDIIDALTGFVAPQQNRTPELFVVGDAKQSIYRFRGADVSVFQDVAEHIARQGGQTVSLDISFRTHPLLLAWINRVAQAVLHREPDLAQPYEIQFERLEAHRKHPTFGRCVELHIIEDAENADAARTEEARILAERIKALQKGEEGKVVYDRNQECWRSPGYGDIAILCQASTVFGYYEAALREAGIPYLTTAGRGYYGRKEIQDLIHLLRVLNDTADELALVGVLRSPLFALDDDAIFGLRFANRQSLWTALMQSGEPSEPANPTQPPQPTPLEFARETLRDLHARRGHLSVVELLREALAATGYLATISGLPDGAQRRANVEKLLNAARQVGSTGLQAFSAYLEDLLKAEPREGEAPLEAEGSVRLMTIHKSKGLEFPIVVLPDLGRGTPPMRDTWLARRSYGLALRLRDNQGETQQLIAYQLALREEKRMERAERERLLYVALTRARDYLLLSGPAANKSNESWLSRLVAALGAPWEQGGPPPGAAGQLEVWQHTVK